jgi:polyketide synthase-associated protein
MALQVTKDEYDLSIADIPNVSIGQAVVGQLAVKGFCTVDLGIDAGDLKQAVEEATNMSAYYQPAFQIMEGLLGPEGSCQIAEMEDVEMSDYPFLKKLDERLSQVGSDIMPSAEQLGFDISHRTNTIVHKAGTADDDTPALTEKIVSKWFSQFTRHQVMAIVFLGPSKGTLELRPYDTDDTDAFEVRAVPGMLCLLRPDILAHKYFAPGTAVSLSSFFLTSKKIQQYGASLTSPMTPVARELDEWVLGRLRQIKESEQEDSIWDSDIPRDWQLAMNHMFHKGQMISVSGVSVRIPQFSEVDPWFAANAAGIDVVTEVPMQRWNHEPMFVDYDVDPECWKYFKTTCKHMAWMEGIDLFDPKLFGMSPAEAKSIDPSQRLILEVGYDSLFRSGLRKKQLMNKNIGHYSGFGCLEWPICEKSSADDGVFSATGTAASIVANRFNFCLGMKGPSLCIDTEGASSLTALYLGAEACQKKGRGQTNPYSVASGVHLLLSPAFWPTHNAAGWLSHKGRCLTFDQSATGFIRGDCCVAATVKALNEVDGQAVEDEIMVGLLAAGVMNQNGMGANMSAPSGPAEQECIAEAIKNARISPLDVDAVESWGAGALLHDAVEVSSLLRGHRSEMNKESLGVTNLKTGFANSVEAAGLCAFIRTLSNGSWGMMVPNKHLRTINPHIDAVDTPVMLPTEGLQFRMKSSFTGTLARGFGGSNVYVIGHTQQESAKGPQDAQQATIAFWPGGGGVLDSELEPTKTYYIVGSMNKWSKAVPMERESDGTFAYTITLGENVFEQFQIWLDGKSEKVLHPGWPKAGKDAPVVGPTKDGSCHGMNWIIDGRGDLQEKWIKTTETSESDLVVAKERYGAEEYALVHVNVPTPDSGKTGDQYRVRLQIFGKWRTVNWYKLDTPAPVSETEDGKYYVVGSWKGWSFIEMTKASASTFTAEISLTANKGDFQIVRDMDWSQTFYPATHSGNGSEYIIGPRDGGHGLNWQISGFTGDTYRITFERSADSKKISWVKI